MILSKNEEDDAPLINWHYIDGEIDTWYEIIETSMDKAIPKKRYFNIPYPKTRDKQKFLQWRYKTLLEIVYYLGWTPILGTQFRELQTEMNDECKILHTTL